MEEQFVNWNIFLELTKLSLIIFSLSLLTLYINIFIKNRSVLVISIGFCYGIICVIGIAMPVYFAPGVIFDARSVIISVGTLFGGPIVGLIAATIAAAFRIWVGGAGAIVGVGVIFVSVLIGWVFRLGIHRNRIADRWWTYGIFGAVVHFGALLCFLALPREIANDVFTNVSVPFFIVLTIFTMLLSLLIRKNHGLIEKIGI